MKQKEKSKKWLWIAGGAAEILMLAVLVLLWLPKPDEPKPVAEVPTTNPVVTTTQSVGETTADTQPTETVSTEPLIPPNPYGTEDFQYLGEYLGCTAGDYVLGVDVSKYQGKIDWEQVRSAGMSFAMIRIGGRGYGQAGKFYVDQMANTYYQGAKAAGLQVGAYFFSQAVTEEEAVEEAKYALELCKNWELELPIVFDWEYIDEEARTANVDSELLTKLAIAFCEEIKAAGKEPMIYLCPWFFLPDLEQLTPYRQWLALYKDEMTYKYRFDMWQYTCNAKVPGIKGDADVNILFPFGN